MAAIDLPAVCIPNVFKTSISKYFDENMTNSDENKRLRSKFEIKSLPATIYTLVYYYQR